MEINKKELAEKVKAEFMHAWNGYKKYAFGHDEFRPLSKTPYDWYEESLCITPIDAFDTMILMGLTKDKNEAKQLIFEELSFDKNIYVSVFEITIRILGGLISAYLLDGNKKFLKLSEDLANRLLPAFNSKTGMPFRFVNLKTGAVRGKINNPAEIGTLLVEFGTLSKLTGNPVYYDRAKKALVELYNRRSKIGLVGTTINIETGKWINKESSIGNKIDSYYEYLLKSYLLFKDMDCKKMWETSIKSVNKYLADSKNNGYWYRQVDMDTGKKISTKFEALAAVFPSIFALSGDLTRAKKLQDSCFKMWTTFDIEPEQIDYKTMKIKLATYRLRPENIESTYYLYHYTKDEKYLKMGKIYLESIIKYCKTEEGYAELKSVITKEKIDRMSSFFLAETLKYLYLLFAPKNTLNFDKIIFNTEAHPIQKNICR